MLRTLLADEWRFLTFRKVSPAIHTHWPAVQRQHALGLPRFQAAIGRQMARRCTPGAPGRPPKAGAQRNTVL